MIYLDYAASFPPYSQVTDKIFQLMAEQYGNPAGLHGAAAQARGIIQHSRKTLAGLLNIQPQQVFFTSGATEANNWAVKTACIRTGKRHMIVFAAEHSSVLSSAKRMEQYGWHVSYVYPNEDGILPLSAVEAAIRPDTGLLCVQAVNNETGVIQDVEGFSQIARKHGIMYLCDGVQSFTHCEVPLEKADFVSLSAHKLGGPMGVGCLVVRQTQLLSPFVDGGGQELGYRSGTENVPGIAGFALAAELSAGHAAQERQRLSALTEFFVQRLGKAAPHMQINGAEAVRRAGIVNCYFPQIPGEELVMRLDLKGICASPGAACAARDPVPSHVLLAMGHSQLRAKNSVRFSFGHFTTQQELEYTANTIGKILGKEE